ncbi:MAG TPA: hypothetical protein VNT01_07325 [Symbiobacteriaceae bacterium]|nr:hypothetical protein [Symbiobacteriaceae bacterium]
MGHTVIGVFRHSGDADLAAAHLREEYTLEAGELDLIGQAEWERMTPPAQAGVGIGYAVAPLVDLGLQGAAMGDEDPIGKRWGDKVVQGQTLLVARTGDPELAVAMARELRVTGADRVDLLPH